MIPPMTQPRITPATGAKKTAAAGSPMANMATTQPPAPRSAQRPHGNLLSVSALSFKSLSYHLPPRSRVAPFALGLQSAPRASLHDLELGHQAVVLVVEHVAMDDELAEVVAEVAGDEDPFAGEDEEGVL